MKQFFILLFTLGFLTAGFSQDSVQVVRPADSTVTNIPPPPKPKWNAANLNNRSSDHLLIQIGYDGWANIPDSINTKGFPRSFNMYFMLDFPFKTSPHFSAAIGVGIGTSNIYFDNTHIDIIGEKSDRLTFDDVSDTNHFKKYKLMTTYVDAPVELRWNSNPYNSNKSWKVAIGGKFGLLLAANTKGKTLQDKNGNTIISYTEKQKSKKYFQSTRLVGMARVGYGVFSLFGTYQLNSFIKEGFGPDVRPYSIGLTISGL